jgi:hypothetical protein
MSLVYLNESIEVKPLRRSRRYEVKGKVVVRIMA